MAVFVLIPFGKVLFSSFQTSLTGQFTGLRNYRLIFQNAAFRLAAGNTARFMAVGAVLSAAVLGGISLILRRLWDQEE